jgi:prepilin-type N-terminal cleavage/methylation domain-containing protein
MSFTIGRKKAGFTLIELLLVMTILGILITLGAPSFTGFVRTGRVKSGARSVAVAVQTARFKAISANRRCYIDFAPGALAPADSFFTIWLDVDGDSTYDAGEVDSSFLVMSQSKGGFNGFKLPKGVNFGVSGISTAPGGESIPADGVNFGGQNKAWFNSRGEASSGSVFLQGEGGAAYAITVSSLGGVRTWRWEDSQWK